MLFNSPAFLVFLVTFLILWPTMRRKDNRRWLFLTAASFFFYGWWNWSFLFLIVGSGMVDYLAGLGMRRYPHRKKTFLIVSIMGNVAALGTFKYLDFCTGNLNELFSLLGLGWHFPAAQLLLPIGISFYTFQSMSYTIDVYRGKLEPTHNVLHFFAYLAMFPQLVAGPIVRAAHMLPQLKIVRKVTAEERWNGTTLVIKGFFKKLVVANSLAPVVEAAFRGDPVASSAGYWWLIIIMFGFQIYCDFSGYTDIARGVAKWMGYDLPLNFDHPYRSASVREFWGRWHISLSTWFRDYVYIPLGGSRCGTFRTHVNVWITMLISGLWHGAAWTFVAWAALHAAYLSIERITRWPERMARLPGGKYVASLIVFLLVTLAWVFFRATSFEQATQILTAMFDLSTLHVVHDAVLSHFHHYKAVLLVAGMLAWEAVGRQAADWLRLRVPATYEAWKPYGMALVIVGCILLRGEGQAFIYFQF